MARAENSLDLIKPFVFSPFLSSLLSCLFLLCVIHIHATATPPPSSPKHPTMHFAKTAMQMFFYVAVAYEFGLYTYIYKQRNVF